MKRPVMRIVSVVIVALALAACGTVGKRPAGGGAIPSPSGAGGVYKVGNPYQVAGVWYYPKEQPNYDETGIASWYGAQFHGHLTANGEVFDRNNVSAAHPTLPMPVNVRVTNLENGKSLVVRVNDRGPYVNGRVIDLSERAADLLGYRLKGTARVRVTYLGRADAKGGGLPPPAETPPEIATAVAAAPSAIVDAVQLNPVAGVAAAAPTVVQPLPQPVAPAFTPPAPEQANVGEVTQVPVPAVTSIYVQAGAYSSMDNARRVAEKLKALGAKVSTVTKDGRPLYRVRIGPIQDVDQADQALSNVHNLGHNDVNIVVE